MSTTFRLLATALIAAGTAGIGLALVVVRLLTRTLSVLTGVEHPSERN